MIFARRSISTPATRFLLAATAFFFACIGPASAAPTPAERVKAFVAGTQSLRANFTQTVSGSAGIRSAKKPQLSSGVFALSRPGKFRWQIDRPYVQLMVSDGERAWLYDPDLKQVTVRRAGAALAGTPASLLAGESGNGGSGSGIEKNFTLRDAGNREGRDWVEALPKSPDAIFSRILLGFKGDLLQVMELSDNFGQTTHILFSALERNLALPASTFSFSPPAGVDVVSE